MHRRTLLSSVVACLFAPLAARLVRAALPRVPPLHVERAYWNPRPDAILDGSLRILGTTEQLQKFHDAERQAMSKLGPRGKERAALYRDHVYPHTGPEHPTPWLICFIHGQRDAQIGYWTLAVAEALSRVGCTMTDEAADALAACTNPNDPKAIQEIRDAT